MTIPYRLFWEVSSDPQSGYFTHRSDEAVFFLPGDSAGISRREWGALQSSDADKCLSKQVIFFHQALPALYFISIHM